MKEIEYVVGFLFDDSGKHVVLIEKQRPEWQRGLLNGVGGKVDSIEDIFTAMRREFIEETGANSLWWYKFAELSGYDGPAIREGTEISRYKIHCFSTFSTICFNAVKTTTDEKLVKRSVSDLSNYHDTLPNTRWLILMALNMNQDLSTYFKIEEVRTDGEKP